MRGGVEDMRIFAQTGANQQGMQPGEEGVHPRYRGLWGGPPLLGTVTTIVDVGGRKRSQKLRETSVLTWLT